MIGRLHGGALAMAIESSALQYKLSDTQTHAQTVKHSDTQTGTQTTTGHSNNKDVQDDRQPNPTATTSTTDRSGQPLVQRRGQGLASISCIEIQYLSAMKVIYWT